MVYTALSQKGQVVIPISIRQSLKLAPNDKLQVELSNGKVLLSPIPNVATMYGVFSGTRPITKKQLKSMVKEHISTKFTAK